MSVCRWKRRGGVRDNAGTRNAAAEKISANSKDGKDTMTSTVELKQGRKKLRGTFMANTCATSGQVVPCVYAGCVYLIRGVRRIRRYVTGAVKVVALGTAHERRNDCRLMLIPLRLASGAGWLRSG